MSGSRCKQIRADFFAATGRYPRRARVELEPVAVPQIEGRKTKAKLLQQAIAVFAKLRSSRRAVVVAQSEWRRLKKDWQRQLSAA